MIKVCIFNKSNDVGWQVTPYDPIWQVTLCSSDGFPWRAKVALLTYTP